MSLNFITKLLVLILLPLLFTAVSCNKPTLVNEVKEPGLHSVKLDGSDLSSGLYFYKLQVNDFISVKKTILLKGLL